jgi:hypothetical protein
MQSLHHTAEDGRWKSAIPKAVNLTENTNPTADRFEK